MLSVGSTAAQSGRRIPVGRGTRAQQKDRWSLTDRKNEFAEIEDKIRRTRLSKQVRQKARHKLKKLPQVSPMSGEATVTRSFE